MNGSLEAGSKIFRVRLATTIFLPLSPLAFPCPPPPLFGGRNLGQVSVNQKESSTVISLRVRLSAGHGLGQGGIGLAGVGDRIIRDGIIGGHVKGDAPDGTRTVNSVFPAAMTTPGTSLNRA